MNCTFRRKSAAFIQNPGYLPTQIFTWLLDRFRVIGFLISKQKSNGTSLKLSSPRWGFVCMTAAVSPVALETTCWLTHSLSRDTAAIFVPRS